LIELEVTPWSVLPDALPPWQTPLSVPKPDAALAAALEEAAADEAGVVAAGCGPPPARLQPATRTAAAPAAAAVLTVSLKSRTGVLLAGS
jgi:hypothetical protein